MNDAERLDLIANICHSDKHKNPIKDILRIAQRAKEIPCPDCYGGHFRPCNICGDSGWVTFMPNESEAKK